MSVLRGIARAGLAYIAVGLALLLAFAIEIGLPVAGLLTGRFADPAGGSACWMPIFVALLCGGVLARGRRARTPGAPRTRPPTCGPA
jgi:hypothetical protein